MFVGDERIDLETGDYCFGPRGTHTPTSSAPSAHGCS